MPTSRLEEHREALEEFSRRLLKDYTLALGSRTGPTEQKEFNDPVWQTVVIAPFEIALLDSPLLQRLRFIRQLGVVHWVYPGATHTRFEHTLGVIHQVQNLVAAINKRSSVAGQSAISQEDCNLLRLIALFHDVGHGVMSHVSENALRDSKVLEDILLDFQDVAHVERPKPSELAAYYMVGSPAFTDLLEVVQGRFRLHALPNSLIAKIQDAIIGKKISDRIPLLHELINGPFDADKLDYMPRDARMTGVPVVTDIPRLIQKVRAVEVSKEELPKHVGCLVAAGYPSYLMTGIAFSGGRTLDELMLGRTLLFDKIYRHQKVRAAESMVASLFECLARLLPNSAAMLPYELVDDQLVNLNLPAIKQLAGRELTGEEETIAKVASDVARRLRERNLFVRSFAFSQHMPSDPYGADERQRAGLDRLIRASTDPQRRGELAGRIGRVMLQVLEILGKKDLVAQFGGVFASYLRIDPPEAASHGSEIYNAHLITPSGEVRRFREDIAETRAWTDAYLLARDLGFVFTCSELSPFVFLAAEWVVRTEFGVRIPRSMSAYAKQAQDVLEGIRWDLAASDFYATAPFDLRPVPRRLSRADVPTLLSQIADNLRGYSGPASAEGEVGRARSMETASKERIFDWLRQFSGEDALEAALEALMRLRLIGRREICAGLRHFLEENPAFEGAFVCPFGEPKDSAAVSTYLAGDLANDFKLETTSLEAALAFQGERPIVFVEDFLGSGRQAVTILEAWLGERRSYDLREVRQPLAESLQGALRDRQIGVVFAAGMKEGRQRLESRLGSLGLSATLHIAIGEENLPLAFPSRGQLSRGQETFREQCQEIGTKLLTDGDPKHTPEWVKERVLGYGNHGLLLVFPYNTPAQTLTCLWKESTPGDWSWSPLLPRRKKR